ncbi:hypothetical protein CcI156_13700 [Frankia sp. CcI156]|nr:hypothetical protein CgIS1_13800 [Frankia sp. CgIS1]ONH25328.1 hypothetical protein CcI156_13700 [Frankia sp. CcI156]
MSVFTAQVLSSVGCGEVCVGLTLEIRVGYGPTVRATRTCLAPRPQAGGGSDPPLHPPCGAGETPTVQAADREVGLRPGPDGPGNGNGPAARPVTGGRATGPS